MILDNICIEQGDSLSKKLDLTFKPDTLGKRTRNEIKELLQMTDCPKIKDTVDLAKNVTDALCQKVWLEKEIGKVRFLTLWTKTENGIKWLFVSL
jgi:hypothetical protein